MTPTISDDNDLFRESFKKYRCEYHAALKAVEEIDDLDYGRDVAMASLHLTLWDWGSRLLPRDADKLPDHARKDHAGHSNVYAAWEAELSERDERDPADLATLKEIGETLERITVHALDLHPKPPVVEPYRPPTPEERRAVIEEICEENPHVDIEDLDL